MRIMMRVGAVRRLHFAVLRVINPSSAPHPAKLRDRWVELLSLSLSKCCRNQNSSRRGNETYLKQDRSNKATLGNASISFSKLLFSHAGGENHCKSNVIMPPSGYAPSRIIIILGCVPGIASIRLVI